MIKAYGAEAYPFDEERLKELEAVVDEAAKQWPERLQHKEHVLVRTKLYVYGYDGWAFCCEACDFSMHPKCALEEEDPKKEGYVGEAEVLYCGDGWTFYREKCYFECPLDKEVLSCDGEEEFKCPAVPLFWSLRAIGPNGRAIPIHIAKACSYGARRKELEVGAKERVQHPLHKVYILGGEIGDGWSSYCEHCIDKEVALKEDLPFTLGFAYPYGGPEEGYGYATNLNTTKLD